MFVGCRAAWVVLWMCALALIAPTMARAQAPSIDDFIEDARLGQASLSPSGRYLVLVRRNGDQSDVVVKDLETGAVTLPIGGAVARESFGGVYITWVEWKTDDRLLLGVTQFDVRRHSNRETGSIRSYRYGENIVSVGRDGSNVRRLEAANARTGEPGDVLDFLENDPDHILLTYGARGFGLDVFKVNVLTGEAERIIDGDGRVFDYIVDRDGKVVGRSALRGLSGRTMVMEALGADGRWTEVFRLRTDEVQDLPEYRFLGPTSQPGQIYVAMKPQEGEVETTASVRVFDFKTRSMGPPVWRNPTYDVVGIVREEGTQELLAGCYWADIYQCDFTDRTLERTMRGIRRFMGDGWSVRVISQARDASRWLVAVSSPNNAGEYYIYDSAAQRMDFVGRRFPALVEERLGTMRRIDYQAGDGQALFGYLTRPPGSTDQARPPLIVMPHGGPEMRDTLTYDQWAQFLTTRGYQVFQPNFRGSSGMGRPFAEAGYRQYGGVMQADVTAGVEHLIAQGLVDAGQICIVGASYGGYAALWGGAAQHELYKCVISIAGMSDLVGIMNWERGQADADSDRYQYWLKSIGDPRADREALLAVSPITRAAGYGPPVLLIHGEDDDVVPPVQSRQMERALSRAGRSVKLVMVENTDHHFGSSRAQRILLSEMETFLAQHMPASAPVYPPPAPAEPEPASSME
ncbi:hypothetical protein ASG17_01720 [Brevundimonas sp. Leaf363]|uniref:alpha/beta hydrolase family protein n=1 Tax=Brevundimonas sp. Leaf363 TaxID=1736353 RepID=UPI0007143DC9|nr:S9 family peptidase [Brevundimonas sp. Leaf363]KQS57465.1 hypothetical protein ASG17_01720 [Brevundimonas sp. Leaf363]